MPLIYTCMALKYFLLCDLSSSTTLTLCSISFAITTSPILKSLLTELTYIDSYLSTDSKWKNTPENLNFSVGHFIIFAKYTAGLALEFLKILWNTD